VGSRLKYSPRPPHTPAILESTAERISRRCGAPEFCRAPQ
jgi:hypothetical protein